MERRHTILETFLPVADEFASMARRWRSDASVRMLQWVWDGYDLLVAEVLSKADWDKARDDLEREITELLEPRVRRCMPAHAFCYIQHGAKERETRLPAPAQPPEYDLAFVLYSNERVKWPMEAKVLHTDSDVSDYVRDIRCEFLTCRYSPFSAEGAMLGYLLSGDPTAAFSHIAKALRAKLAASPHFPDRHHRTSSHQRQVPAGRPYPRLFRCHHLIMRVQSTRSSPRGACPSR